MKKSTVVAGPGQAFRTLSDGRETTASTACVGYDDRRSRADGCPLTVPAVLGVLEPRCPGCFVWHRELLEAGRRGSR